MSSNQEEEVQLFGVVPSPFVTRVDIALNLKGIEYKFVEEKLGNFSETLIKYNPVHKKVPVLVHNGKPISESRVILEYIDDTWNQNPILPSDPYKRALARFWSNFIDDKFLGALRKLASSLRAKESIQESIEELEVVFQFLENELNEKFFGGEEIGLVDITGVYIAFWFPVMQEVSGLKVFTNEKFPKLYKWSQDLTNYQVVKEKLPNRETLLAYFRARYEGLVASK
ncbi:putative glutathione S-transferase [Trifolium repens]|nr:putative glutathione S-transferase [Trifolium repens]